MKDAKIQFKSDQEPAIVNLQTEIQELRSGMVIPTNSPVGESQCNGHVENTIRRIQENVRALGHLLECGIKCKVFDNAYNKLDGEMGSRIIVEIFHWRRREDAVRTHSTRDLCCA